MITVKIDNSKYQIRTHTKNAKTFITRGNICGSDSLPHIIGTITSHRYHNYDNGYNIGVKLCSSMAIGDVRTVFNGVSKLTITRIE